MALTRVIAATAIAVSLIGCSANESSRGPVPSATSTPETATTLDVPDARATIATAENPQPRIDQLQSFHLDDALAGEQCDDLAGSNGTVQLDASRSQLARTIQNSTAVPADDLHLVVNFGSGLPSFMCTDIESEMHTAVILESWPASARAAVFTVTPAERCSVAKLELRGVVATAPNGETVALGDITITNQAWQWWPPFECHLDDTPQG